MNSYKIGFVWMIMTAVSFSFAWASSDRSAEKSEAKNAEAQAESSEKEGEEEEVSSSRVGPGLAVTAFDKEDGFQMSEKALKSLKIKFEPLNGSAPWTIPQSALVTLKHSTGVYRRYENWISFVLVKVIKKSGSTAVILSEDLQAGDEIASSGVTFLRMTEADLNSDTVDNCSH